MNRVSSYMDILDNPDRFYQLWSSRIMADEYATLRLAYAAGATIQAWRLVTGAASASQGHWVDLTDAPRFVCPVHLYRVKPESES